MQSLIFVLFFIVFEYVHCNPARESYQRTEDILKIVERIEEQLNKENRLREIADIFRLDSTVDKMGKKLDRLVELLERSRGSSTYSRSMMTTDDSTTSNDVSEKLGDIDGRLNSLEQSMEKMDHTLTKDYLSKLGEIDQRSNKLKDDLDQKLRKMMNIITAIYEMNKDMKTNLGGRSATGLETPKQDHNPNMAAEFLIANLEELERKIKEQFSVLTNELRFEITSLKIVASNVGAGCSGSSVVPDYEYDYKEGRSTNPKQTPTITARRTAKKDDKAITSNADASRELDEKLDNLVQSLGRTTREIREEINQGIQTIDLKLSNLSSLPLRCEEQLDPSASVVRPVRVSRGYEHSSERNSQTLEEKSDGIKETCTKNTKNIAKPKSCAELRKDGVTCDGTYIIFPTDRRAVRVYCDMTTENGGWIVLVRRGDYGDKMTSFHRNWQSYKNGFGDTEGEFWIGNDVLHLLTTQEENLLRVHLESFDDDDLNMTFSSFRVADEKDNYRMRLGPAVGTRIAAANSLKYHNNQPFSTFDKKNDPFEQNCAATYKGGWWYNGCYFGFLTGEYFKPEDKRENWQGILWYDWKGNAALKGGAMMIRPKDFAL